MISIICETKDLIQNFSMLYKCEIMNNSYYYYSIFIFSIVYEFERINSQDNEK